MEFKPWDPSYPSEFYIYSKRCDQVFECKKSAICEMPKSSAILRGNLSAFTTATSYIGKSIREVMEGEVKVKETDKTSKNLCNCGYCFIFRVFNLRGINLLNNLLVLSISLLGLVFSINSISENSPAKWCVILLLVILSAIIFIEMNKGE